MSHSVIRIRGARQNNLRDLDLDIPLGELVVVTGVSGSGKSSLAFDTVYAEGQRRYVETFSPYARQFLDRMDRPAAERIEGIPPAIAIDQTNPVRTSRSTVGTMTELNDHLKLLFARAAALYCRRCGARVAADSAGSVAARLLARAPQRAALVSFRVPVPDNFEAAEVEQLLAAQGYTRFLERGTEAIEVVQDRLRLTEERRDRLVEALEAAFEHGRGRVAVHLLDANREPESTWRFSTTLHCADCDIDYRAPSPNRFSFNSPAGACDNCRGFGRVMGIDPGLVVPDTGKSLAQGAVRPWQSDSYQECQRDLLRFAAKRGIPVDIPWRELTDAQRRWVMEGEGDWSEGVWYGVRRFFDWLETKSYRMHIRVLLSRYRSYDTCPDCHGARLKPEALLWRLGNFEQAAAVLPPAERFRPQGLTLTDAGLAGLPGLCLHDVVRLPLERARRFFSDLTLPPPLDQATELLLEAIRHRLDYLVTVGLGYLSLDRQSRTLSGGEVQRINLTTALGTSLVNTLFVLDEPSIGLHPRDISRLVGILQRLRDAGNSLLVVEHDPEVIRAADRVLDLGPGPGEHGGRLVFAGPPGELARRTDSRTGAYLAGRARVEEPRPAEPPGEHWLELLGAREHNLQEVDLRVPLNRLVCLTGVSGSGKSSLLRDVLYPALRQLQGEPTEAPGAHDEIRGFEALTGVVLVDQSPIGRTTRSNPASYVGALKPIREAFAAQPLARERGYTAGTFSFNSGGGRCPACSGNGFEHVEMQFLSDVYLRCPECDGKRFRDEVLEITLAPPPGQDGLPLSMAEVLELTVTEALSYFAGQAEVGRRLEPLQALGLGYLRLGQPVPTLSGGEAQRLKLAGHLGKSSGRERMLFLLDEPTTGLHFDDIALLLAAFRRLLAQGHSLLVIEHNLDVIGAADWIVDLGPEGGDGGGRIVAEGPPAELERADSHTGAALAAYRRAAPPASADQVRDAAPPPTARPDIHIHHAREHNLQGVDVTIPRDRLTVITGVSGSGKSTLAFDILFNEGQRRYLESLNAYARQFVQPAARPDVDAIFGIPPTVAIEQRTSRGGWRSTVATLTEIHHFLRLLFVRLGRQHCPECRVPIDALEPEAIQARLLRDYRGREVHLLAPLVTARKGIYPELAAWAAGRGYRELRVDGEFTPTDPWPRLDRFREHDIELPVARLRIAPGREAELADALAQALRYGQGTVRVAPVANGEELVLSTRRACPKCGRGFPEPDPRLFSFNSRHGWCPGCHGTGRAGAGEDDDDAEPGEPTPCPDCGGRRLRPDALAVDLWQRDIARVTADSVMAAAAWFDALQPDGREAEVARDVLPEIRHRLRFLEEVGLGYLTLDRAAPTLSGGEAQRIRLAAQLGSNLQGVCYVLDEPTIGLHPRDNRMLLGTLERLEGKGNTIVVVEHDEETIRRAEHVIDLGPGAGSHGGRVVADGDVETLLRHPDSVTGRYLAQPLPHPLLGRRRERPAEHALGIRGATLHNLQELDLTLPLGRLVCVTGVSGSGKSSLVRGVLAPSLAAALGRSPGPPAGCRRLDGAEAVDRVLEVDQSPIGKTPRSCAATYTGIWDDIRKLFAGTPEARMRGFGPGRFSFNTADGRCPECDGQGQRKVEMSFLPDVTVPCETCHGARFTAETLAVRYLGLTAAEVLDLSVEAAAATFAAHSRIHRTLRLMDDVGLGYLRLGQASPTLSGGEAQRLKLVTELARQGSPKGRSRRAPRTLYLLDEPTVGLHMADVEKLLRVLHRLVDAGGSVLLIEHNLDIIADADWIVDLGPEGGDGGGRLVSQGSPEKIAAQDSHTGRVLREFLESRDG